ncbi:MAG: sugar-transfer associated ATP-grasp domain-containing protein [Methylococcaceae bacterium]
MSWRFLLPNQSWTVQLHRQVLLRAWPLLPRWVWGLIVIYSSSSWLLWHGWRQIYRNFQKHSKTVLTRDTITAAQQLSGLLKAAYLHGIPAHAYYQFKLYYYPDKHWLDFVYTHELPHWHQTLSPQISVKTQLLLSDKAEFSKRLTECDLSTVETLRILKRGQHLDTQDLFTGQSCFLKPNIGSRGEGCLILNYCPEFARYRLVGDKIGQDIQQPTLIIDYIVQQVQQRDYLIQPLLTNHPLIQQYSPTETLVTLRLISTCAQNQQPTVVSALLEIPAPEQEKGWWLIAVDCETGCFIDSSDCWFKPSPAFIQTLHSMATQAIPFWSETVTLCIKAHYLCADIISIGWDVVITPDGVQLLEGNINWGIAQHQIAYNKPALGEVYHASCC